MAVGTLARLPTQEPQRAPDFAGALLQEFVRPLHVLDALVGKCVQGVSTRPLSRHPPGQDLDRRFEAGDNAIDRLAGDNADRRSRAVLVVVQGFRHRVLAVARATQGRMRHDGVTVVVPPECSRPPGRVLPLAGPGDEDRYPLRVVKSGSRTFVIIGNGIAGTTAAETLRKGDPEARVVLIGDEPHPLYNRVALPKVLKGVTAPERTIIKSLPWHVDNRVELRLTTTASVIDTERRQVVTDDGETYAYDSLLVATGGTPNPLNVPGTAGTNGVYNFQTLEDTKTILDRVRRSKGAVTTGGSFIAYELTEGFRHHGVATTWLIRGSRFLHRILDEDGGRFVDHLAREVGVETVYGDSVGEVRADADGELVSLVTSKGREIECDLLGAGLGLRMRLECLEGTPIKVNRGIVTNEYLETNVPDVYAAGDVAEFYDVSIGAYNQMGTWNSAGAHGRVAAANMLGNRTEFREVPYYTSTMFDSQMAAIGIMPESVPDMEAVTRLNLDRGVYRRLFFHEGRLAGAALIGDIRVRREMMDTIRSQRAVSNAEREHLLSI